MCERENRNTGLPLPSPSEHSLIICKTETTDEDEVLKTHFIGTKVKREPAVSITLLSNTPLKEEFTQGEIVERIDSIKEEQLKNHHCINPAPKDIFGAEKVTHFKIEDNESLDPKIFDSYLKDEVEIKKHSLDFKVPITNEEEGDFGFIEKITMPLFEGENKDNKLLLPLVAVVTNQSQTSCKEEPDDENQTCPVKLINSSPGLENEVAVKIERTDMLVDLVPTILFTNSGQLNLNSEQIPHFKSTDLNAFNATEIRNSLQRKCSSINKTTCKNCGKQFEDVKNPFCGCSDGWLSSTDDNKNAAGTTRECTPLHSTNIQDYKKTNSKSFAIKQHKTKIFRQKQFTCHICNNGFSCSSELKIHQIIHTGEAPFTCNICNKSFSRSSTLNVHNRTHTGETPFTCNICNKSFSQSSTLYAHKRTHTGETPFTCNICNKSFSQSSTLNAHKRTHTGETPFTCNICNTGFSQSSTLNAHKRTHTGETPFTCNICNTGFSQSSTLNKHKRTHTGETPFTCNICNKSFSQSYHFNAHKRTHTGETPFTCNICNKSFSHSSTINVHKRTHTGETPFACNICYRRFSSSSALAKHKRLHRKETMFT